MLRQAKENADDLVRQKADLEQEQKALEQQAAPKEIALQKKLKTIVNYVHGSVPVSDDEVRKSENYHICHDLSRKRTTMN